MNRGLRNELLTLFGIGALGSFVFHRPRAGLGFGLAAASVALLAKDESVSFQASSAVITGGSRGLGLALAKELVRKGASVTLLARDAEELERARELILFETPGARVQTIPCDVTQDHDLSKALEEAMALWGSIDMLINNAGAILVGPFDTLTKEDFEAQMRLHLYAVIKASQWVVPHFRRRRRGRIVNICSLGGKVAVPHMLPYDASKFALAGFSQGLTAELQRDGIPVTTVYPTLLRTGSPIQAVFKGDHEKEFAWFASSDQCPGLSMSATKAARKILEAAREGKTEVILNTMGRWRVGASIFFPELMSWSMAMLNRLLPRGRASSYHTGAESQAAFNKKVWTYFFRRSAAKVEKELNQVPKEDAKFNLGLLH